MARRQLRIFSFLRTRCPKINQNLKGRIGVANCVRTDPEVAERIHWRSIHADLMGGDRVESLHHWIGTAVIGDRDFWREG